jgi:two-component system, NarL family, response regulator NreC
MSLRLVLADDHPILRQGIRALVEREGMQVIAEAADGLELVRHVTAQLPDVVVADVSMPILNGIDSTRQMLALFPSLGVVLLTMYDDESRVAEALRAGVRGYVPKTQAADELMEAVRTVAAGGTYLSPRISRIVANAYVSGTDMLADPLTLRERVVLQMIADGHTTRQIAATLNVAVKTAESYRTRVMEKLDIHDIAGLVRYAVRRGVISA